jgi:two-component system, chemotaxis family, CheB/CheR fusion protein
MKEVLIVDDDRDGANTLAALLQLEGFVTHVAFEGNEAIAKAIACNPDAFILDIQMPRQDGFQLAHRLREMPQFRNKRYIALTGFSDQEHLDRASNLAFDDYLVKPCKLDVLMAILREIAHPLQT